MSALARMAFGTHRHFVVEKGDTVIITASVIPGNERMVTNIINSLMETGANVYYDKALDYTLDPKTRNMVKYNIAHLNYIQEKFDLSLRMLDSLYDSNLETSTRLRKYYTKCMIYEAKDDQNKFLSSYKYFLRVTNSKAKWDTLQNCG